MEGVDWAVNYLHSLVIQFPATSNMLNQQFEATVSVKVKGEEEAGLPSDRIMVGGFSQVLNKHRKNCECCPVSLLIVRNQRLS